MENKPTENRPAPDARDSIAPPNKCNTCVVLFAYPFSKETQSYTENCEDDAIEYDLMLFERARRDTGTLLMEQCYREMDRKMKERVRQDLTLDELTFFFVTEICALQHLIQRIVVASNLDLQTLNPLSKV